MTVDPRLLPRIRREFPAAAHDPYGRLRAFLDNGAGTLVTRRAAEAEAKARVDWSANVGNVFPESRGAEAVILEGRRAVADLLNAEGWATIVSGESATALLFNLGHAVGKDCTSLENVVVLGYEHFANVSPWEELKRAGRVSEVRYVPFDKETGLLDMGRLGELVDMNTKVVAAMAASNVLGTRSDLRAISKVAHESGALLVVDGVHHIAHGPTDVRGIGADALVFSGYKLFSRHGSFLYLRPELVEGLSPYKVEPSPEHGPGKWEWGTRDQAMFAAIAGSVDYLAWLGAPNARSPARRGRDRAARVRKGLEWIEEYEAGLTKLVLEGDGRTPGLLDAPGLTLYGPRGIPEIGRDPTFSFKIAGLKDREVSQRLWDGYGLAVGAEDYYSRALRVVGVETMVRATFVHYNTPREARLLLTAIGEIAKERR